MSQAGRSRMQPLTVLFWRDSRYPAALFCAARVISSRTNSELEKGNRRVSAKQLHISIVNPLAGQDGQGRRSSVWH